MAGLSNTQRTLRALKEQGRVAAITEKWNQFAGPHGVRQDLFGFVDVLALDPQRGFVGVQCCSGSGFSAHWKKLTEERNQEVREWLSTPGGVVEIWAWRQLKVKRGGKAKRWEPRIVEVTLEDL